MDSTFNTLAIILKREDWKENDSLITAYSKDKGKLRLIAKGAKKIKSKTAGHLEPLIFSRLMVVRGKNDFDYIGTAIGEDFYTNIREDEQKIFSALHALNLVEKMTREGEVGGQAEVFNLLKNFLDELNTPSFQESVPSLPREGAGSGLCGCVIPGLTRNPVSAPRTKFLDPGSRPGMTTQQNSAIFDAFSQKLAAILGFSQEDFEELFCR